MLSTVLLIVQLILKCIKKNTENNVLWPMITQNIMKQSHLAIIFLDCYLI